MWWSYQLEHDPNWVLNDTTLEHLYMYFETKYSRKKLVRICAEMKMDMKCYV